jgi:stage V sporulation protein B
MTEYIGVIYMSNLKKLRPYLNLKYMRNPIVKGTFLLTLSGIITKFIGFFYRIFLSRIFNEESLGIFGLIAPVMMLANSVCAVGIQNAITRFVAASKKEKTSESYGYLVTGITLSLALSCLIAYITFTKAPFIAINIIGERRCTPLLRISALTFPLATIHSCINGFFYGQKRAAAPAVSMIIEQLVRVTTVFALCKITVNAGGNVSLSYICIGMLMGEFASAFFSCLVLIFKPNAAKISMRHTLSYKKSVSIMSLALPISLNRVFISLMSSVETIQLPKKLVLSGLSSSQALSVYGVFSGMAYPLIMFPSAITASMSSLLLPSVSEAQSQGDKKRIRKYIFLTTAFCSLLGIFFFLIFFLSADLLGKMLFKSDIAASQIRALSFICPFLYLSGSLCSILHGLGKTTITFIFNVLSIVLRLCFIFFAVPYMGFSGYIYGTLCSQIFFVLLIILALRHYIIYN